MVGTVPSPRWPSSQIVRPGARGALPSEVEWLLMEPAVERDVELASLLDTRDLTFDDLARELAMLVANLEM